MWSQISSFNKYSIRSNWPRKLLDVCPTACVASCKAVFAFGAALGFPVAFGLGLGYTRPRTQLAMRSRNRKRYRPFPKQNTMQSNFLYWKSLLCWSYLTRLIADFFDPSRWPSCNMLSFLCSGSDISALAVSASTCPEEATPVSFLDPFLSVSVVDFQRQ